MKTPQITKSSIPVPKTGFLRLSQIIGNPEKNIPPLIPISKSTWWSGVKSGRYPKPVKISERCTAWHADEVFALMNISRADSTDQSPEHHI